MVRVLVTDRHDGNCERWEADVESCRRKHRRLAKHFLNTKAISGYVSGLELEVSSTLENLYIEGKAGKVPINPQSHVGRISLNNILTIVFGMRTSTMEHPLVAHWLRISREFMSVFFFHHFQQWADE